jgi:hypothetical protein
MCAQFYQDSFRHYSEADSPPPQKTKASANITGWK